MRYTFSCTKLAWRICLFILISGSWYFAVWWCAIPLTIAYVWYYQGYELIVLGVLIDIQFLSGIRIPYYTFIFLLLVIVAHVIKPMVRPRHSFYEIE